MRRRGERCSAWREARAVAGEREMAERGTWRDRRTEWNGDGVVSSMAGVEGEGRRVG